MSAITSVVVLHALSTVTAYAQTGTADNGNGACSNLSSSMNFPIPTGFSDPDRIRAGTDFYLTGTTMNSMPGLPILRSRDLLNWTFVTYAPDPG